ncbi:TPA: ribonuclease R [Candidatus Nomurabacteria bacterium]|nr:MAG: Ribonuclease R [Parcubacteria bacterium RAAC4_OD1_1]HCY26570.1 ribonuclease R [Candidatus Nomurabacteria bacterium]
MNNDFKDKYYKEGQISISHKGIGRVTLKENGEVVEIEHNFLRTALHGDSVLIFLHPKKKNDPQTGEVRQIKRRSKKGFAGILEYEDGIYFLIPSDLRMYADIIIPKEKLNGAQIGQKIFVSIIEWTDQKKSPIGEVTEVLGAPNEHNVEMRSIALEKGFSEIFDEGVLKEAERLKEIGITEKEISKRRDMRGTLTFTIDPYDAKDFDDAISFKEIKDGLYEIGIHIADVSHYVREGSILDKEAYRRGTSVYLVDRTIPMLPEVLSNDLCSLKPDVERLTFSIIFEIDKNGKILKEWIDKTVIKSNKRFSYEEAQKSIENKDGIFHKELDILNKIAKKIAKERFKNGAIVLDQEEVKFELDKDGIPIKVFTKKRLDTHRMIEEYMLLANRRIAERMSRKKKGGNNIFLYRIHDTPNKEKMQDLAFFLKKLGYKVSLKNGVIPSEEINSLINKLEGNPLRDMVHTAIIRTMAKAIYSVKNIGHYGLAFKYYTHFTSPIRRYPDIVVHRILESEINNKLITNNKFQKYQEISLETSGREKEAAEAERASIKYKQVEYMSSRIGDIFEGTITGVTEWGLYIEERETKCEGMAQLRNLKSDFYDFDRKHMRIIGKKTHKKYTLGDKVKFKVIKADMNKKTIDYDIIEK